MHTCPMVDPGPKPHVGGPILTGSPTVIIGGMPAARLLNLRIEHCPLFLTSFF